MANGAPLLLDVTRLIWRRWADRQPTGVDRVCLAYLDRFADRAQAVVHHPRFRRILDSESSKELFDLVRDPPRRFRPALVRRALLRAGGRACESLGRPYLNVGHTGLNQDGFRAWVRRSRVRPIYLVHDLIPITNPELCRAAEAERHLDRMRTMLATASGIIGNSQATLNELARFAEREGSTCPPSIAAWLGTEGRTAAPYRTPMVDTPTFVVLGTIEARKNHLLLLKIWSRLSARMGAEAPRLLIIGQRGWEADEVFDLLDSDETLRSHAVELNRCSDENLYAHLESARALLFPSKAEGYGLPLVEALAAGIPVIASDLGVFREIGAGIPLLLDPTDEPGWEAAILDFVRPNSAARAEQLRRLATYRPPTWDDHFRAVEAWFATIA